MGAEELRAGGVQGAGTDHWPTLPAQEIRFPKMVTSCCRFLCYFCRISRQNQRSMFDHLSYLLENSGIGLGESPRAWAGGAVPHGPLLVVHPHIHLCWLTLNPPQL